MTDLPVLLYAYDPLCGWCFGFGPAMRQIRAELAGEVRVELACGGLVTGERVRPVAADREYLVAGLARVEQVTGVRAGAAYFDGLLAEGTWVSDSEPPCRALRVVLDLQAEGLAGPDAAIDLGHALTDALYVDGLAPDAPETIRRCATAVGLDGDEVVRRWQDPQAREATARWFAAVRAQGVTTYPSLFLRHDDRLVPLAEGAVAAADVVAAVRSLLAPAG